MAPVLVFGSIALITALASRNYAAQPVFIPQVPSDELFGYHGPAVKGGVPTPLTPQNPPMLPAPPNPQMPPALAKQASWSNKQFVNDVMMGLRTFKLFEESMPGAKEELKKVLNSPSITNFNQLQIDDSKGLPDPMYLVKTVEEGLAIHSSFKKFLRGILKTVQENISRSSMQLAENVIKLKATYNEMVETMHNLNETKSPIRKVEYVKELVEQMKSARTIAWIFNNLERWRNTLINGVSESL